MRLSTCLSVADGGAVSAGGATGSVACPGEGGFSGGGGGGGGGGATMPK